MRRAKTATPVCPPAFVDRARLRDLLDRAVEPRELGRVVLVSAPAGQGKTAMVADWLRHRPATASAWVSLDAGDREEASWWAAVGAALRTIGGSGPPGPHDTARDGATAVLDTLDGRTRPTILVLDDVHEIVGHPAFDGLLDLLRHPLPTTTIVLCSRFDPPLGLPRLRLHGRLAEVRATHLSFTTSEAVSLFARQELTLSDEQVAALVDRTEGWVAALRLAALSLREIDDTDAFVASFAGDDRSVADYLVGEVLSRLDPQQHAVLEAASVCSPLSVDLAVELTGQSAAATVLDHLEALTALVTATDRRRSHFRTHQLLSSHILARLRRRDPARLVELYRRARCWHERHGDHPRALRCAAAAGDVAAVRLVVRSRAIELIGQGAFDALAQTEDVLAADADDPRVRLVLGLTAVERGDVDRGERLVESAENELTSRLPRDQQGSNLIVFRRIVASRIALVRGRLPAAVAAGATIDPDETDDVALRTMALITRGTTMLTSDRERARADCEEALALADHHGWPYLSVQAHSNLAMAHNFAGGRALMERHARAVIERSDTHGWQRSPWTSRARFALATAALLRGQPHDALHHIESAQVASPPGHPHFDAVFAALRGAAEHDTGDVLRGWQRLRKTRLAHHHDQRELHEFALAALHEHQAALALGRAREAHEVTRAASVRLAGSAELALLHARDLWVGRDPHARTTLATVLTKGLQALTSLTVVEAPLLAAEIALDRDEIAIARRRLHQALSRADRLEVLRPLRHAADPVRRHLAEHRGSFDDLEPLVDHLLADVPTPRTGYLTDRERDVLELLPTMRSAADIAHDLTVSLNTVKTHQRAIYLKLGVDNRRQAVIRARQIGLLVPDRGSSAG